MVLSESLLKNQENRKTRNNQEELKNQEQTVITEKSPKKRGFTKSLKIIEIKKTKKKKKIPENTRKIKIN